MREDYSSNIPFPFGEEWTVEKKLGQGSYGVVYQISRGDAGSRITSAMKWIPLPPDESEIRQMLDRGKSRTAVREYYEKMKTGFSEEIQLLYKLRGNSHIVSLEDFKIVPRKGRNEIGYDLFIRMELLTSLHHWLARKTSLTYRDILQLGMDLCDALTDCSRLSIIHRDIKPDNIFVTDDNRFKLGDFGIARRLQIPGLDSTQRVGSLGYMSPEVFHGKAYDLRADLYSLGLVLYKLMNRMRGPFEPEDASPEVIEQANERRLNGEEIPRPDQIPGSLEGLWAVLQKACAPRPEDRFPTPQEMKDSLQALTDLPAADLPVTIPGIIGSGTGSSAGSSGRMNMTQVRIFPPPQTLTDSQTPPPAERVPPEAPKPPKADGKKSRIRWILIAAAALAAVVLGVVLLLPKTAPKPEPAPAAWKITDVQPASTSLTLSWENAPEGQIALNCFHSGSRIRRIEGVSSPFTLSGLVPETEYTLELLSGGQSLRQSAVTSGQPREGQVPLIQRADLFSVKRTRLEGTPLTEVDDSYFDYVPDSVLQVRTGPETAQLLSHTLWLYIPSVAESRTFDLVLALKTPDGVLFSRESSLALAASGKAASYRVSLDRLLADVFDALREWPKGDCSLRVWLDGMMVFEKNLRFETGS